MLRCVLPSNIWAVIENKIDFSRLFEIRLRAAMPVVVLYGGQFFYLTNDGVSSVEVGAIFCDRRQIESVVQRACEYSIYAYANQLKQGYITIAGGVRIGVSGEVVTENGTIKTIKNFAALNIRLPHEVAQKNEKIVEKVLYPRPKNTLIISPPGAGKTTLLREIARRVSPSKTGKIYSCLILDERSEIAAVNGAIPSLKVGNFCDIITSGSKEYGFNAAIRAMRPDIIITDELSGEQDALAVSDAIASGVVVFASAHGKNLEDLARRKGLESVMKNKVFNHYILLSDRHGPGTVEGFFDEDFAPCQY